MPAPVRVKVWGLVWMTRRGFLIGQGVGLVLVGVLVVLGLSVPRPEPVGSEPLPTHVALMATFFQWLPALALCLMAAAAVENFVVLKKFRQAEAAAAAQAAPPPA
jgi:hypothetical protein